MTEQNGFAATPTEPRKGVIEEHWCMQPGCKRWGSFGVQTRYGTLWHCGEHRDVGEMQRT